MPIFRRRSADLIRITSLLAAFSVIAACGGGGGGSPAVQAPSPLPATYSIGGAVSGLIGSLVLQNNGANNLTVTVDGNFSFGAESTNGATYDVTVLSQPVGQDCTVDQASGTVSGADVSAVTIQCRPTAPVLSIAGREVRMLRFTWPDVAGETEYRLLEDFTGTSSFILRGILGADSEQADIEIFVPEFVNAQYLVQACDAIGCVDSNVVSARSALSAAIGYAKPSNADAGDSFGGFTTTGEIGFFINTNIALSSDGNTLAVGAPGDDSSSTGTGGDSADNGAVDSGATFVFIRFGPGAWELQAYIKASNAEGGDSFGSAVALSNDGDTMVIGAPNEDSAATGIGGDQSDNTMDASGAVYIFARDNAGGWSQQAYLKASNTGAMDNFGSAISLSGDGETVVAGAWQENSNATGINGDQSDNTFAGSGAAYVFLRDGSGSWTQNAYVKSSNTESGDSFGWMVDLDESGTTLAVSAKDEDSSTAGIGADQTDNSAGNSGAVYIFNKDGAGNWSQSVYVKSSNPDSSDIFGWNLALSNDASTLVVGAPNEGSAATGIDGNPFDNSSAFSGAAYVYSNDGFGNWIQQAYLKASNTRAGDVFGNGVAVSSDGSRLVVGGFLEASDADSIDGDQINSLADNSGAVFLFDRNSSDIWSQRSYIKAPNSETDDLFGASLALSGDGQRIAVGAPGEDSVAGPGGDQSDNSAEGAGAVYIY